MIHTIKDFQKGEKVYHLSNPKIMMVAVEIHVELNEISCRWVDNKGITQSSEFMPEELGKASDRSPKIISL
jgi:hypothetical protein